jgi:hypothetical protein
LVSARYTLFGVRQFRVHATHDVTVDALWLFNTAPFRDIIWRIILTEKHFLLPVPSEGIFLAVRRLIDAHAEDAADARTLLKRWWPKAVETILTHWIDATTPHAPAPSPPVVVAPLGRGRVLGSVFHSLSHWA